MFLWGREKRDPKDSGSRGDRQGSGSLKSSMIHKTHPVVAQAVTILWGAGISEGAVYKFNRKLKEAASKHDITCGGSHDITCAGSHDITYTVL